MPSKRNCKRQNEDVYENLESERLPGDVMEFCRLIASILRRDMPDTDVESIDKILIDTSRGEGLNARKTGRPRVTDRPGFLNRYKTILERLSAGDISRRRAAKELGIGYATLKRLLDSNFLSLS